MTKIIKKLHKKWHKISKHTIKSDKKWPKKWRKMWQTVTKNKLTFDTDIPTSSEILLKFAINGSKACEIPTPNSALVKSNCVLTFNLGTRRTIFPKCDSLKYRQYGNHCEDIAKIWPTGNFSFDNKSVICRRGSSSGIFTNDGTSSSVEQELRFGLSVQEIRYGKVVCNSIISTTFVLPFGNKNPPGWNFSNLKNGYLSTEEYVRYYM